jgi:hypothetical protein
MNLNTISLPTKAKPTKCDTITLTRNSSDELITQQQNVGIYLVLSWSLALLESFVQFFWRSLYIGLVNPIYSQQVALQAENNYMGFK